MCYQMLKQNTLNHIESENLYPGTLKDLTKKAWPNISQTAKILPFWKSIKICNLLVVLAFQRSSFESFSYPSMYKEKEK